MGFSSFLCSKTGNSIPAYPYAELPAVLSHVRVLFSDGSFIEGYYDGYGRVHAREDYQAYCTRETQEKYHADQKNSLFYWNELEKRGLLTSEDSFKDLHAHMRIVRILDYNGEKFSDLEKLESCKAQGYFYSARERVNLIKSILKKERNMKTELKPKKKTYTFFSDPGHGWLKVPLKDIIKLGIQDKISSYSYERGTFVYLEEDGDASIFLDALKATGKEFKIKESWTNRRSKIRSYNLFTKLF